MNTLLEKISELLFETKSNQERTILIYLRDNIEQVPNLTVAAIADNNFCSPTSVTRTIKKLNYQNFKDFQISTKYLLNLKEDVTPIINNRFINAVHSSNCLYIYGKGASYISAIHMSRQLIKIGVDCSLIYEQDLLYSLHDKTVVIISNSGETSSVIDIVKDISIINNCTILALTQSGSTLHNLAKHSIIHNISINDDREDQTALIASVNAIISTLK